jgi:hypothetical protein
MLAILLLTTTAVGQTRESVLEALSDSTIWRPADLAAPYDSKNLEQLAGPAETARIQRYGFVGATSQEWSSSEGSARLTIYEMIDSSAAYAVFTLARDINRRGYQSIAHGTEGFRQSNRSWFWQSKFVICVEGPEQAADSLGRSVSENILGRSVKPPVANLLPPLYLVPGSERYILYPEDLDPALKLDAATAGFEDSVEIATAAYDVDQKRVQLILLLYPTQQIAKKYFDAWKSATPEGGPFRKRVASVISLIRGTADAAIAGKILDPVNYETQVTWNEPRPDISFPDLILTIFTFIGLAVLFVTVAGISFGGLRVFVKARYPNRVFDRAEDMEIIQLKLNKGVTVRELCE